MKSLTIKVDAKDVVLNLPETLAEIDYDYLSAVTSNVNIAENYALVALCVSEKLNVMCDVKRKNVEVKGVAKFIKANDPKRVCPAARNEVVIISPTDLLRGHEVRVEQNVLAPSYVTALMSSDKEFMRGIFNETGRIWLVTFKLVPLADIHGSYSNIKNENIANVTKKYVVM